MSARLLDGPFFGFTRFKGGTSATDDKKERRTYIQPASIASLFLRLIKIVNLDSLNPASGVLGYFRMPVTLCALLVHFVLTSSGKKITLPLNGLPAVGDQFCARCEFACTPE